MKGIRTDIQALRGLAVLLVVFYHARIGSVAAGYLGVDVFFVISGFLITGLVKTAIERGDFRFGEFYLRRAKRLLPAAYVTFLAAAVAAPLFLGAAELREFASQMAGAVTFTGNIVLWRQSGYFDGPAEMKPLLHVWSLAVEEQYYLLLPAALALTAPKRWRTYAIAVFALSLALCIVGGFWKPAATFYLLPTRAWEIAIGSIVALSTSGPRLERLERWLVVPAVVALLAIPFVPIGGNHPGADALVLSLATAIVIRRNHPLLNTSLPPKLLARVGDISYSLYLAHWPIFAFAKNAWYGNNPGHPPQTVRAALLLLSFAVAYALYRYVETPTRRAELRISPSVVSAGLAASLGLIVLPFGMVRVFPGDPEIAYARRLNLGFGQACEFGETFEAKPACRDSDAPAMLVWGDSFAMHLVPGIASTTGSGVVQATRSMCAPFLDIAPLGISPADEINSLWAKGCMSFNRSVLAYLANAPSIRTVVLSSSYEQYVDPGMYVTVRQTGERVLDSTARVSAAEQGLRQTLDAIHAMGKRAILVAPPPSTGFPVGTCLERLAEGKLTFGAPPECMVSTVRYRRTRSRVLSFLARVRDEQRAPVFSFDSLLCDPTSCRTSIGGTFLYRDAGHLSEAGSRLIGKQLSLAGLLEASAR